MNDGQVNVGAARAATAGLPGERSGAISHVLRALIGRPLASTEQATRKIGVVAGIPAVGLDALASCAYGPEAALAVLTALGGVGFIAPVTGAVVVLLVILCFSYRQTISEYPQGGGSYAIAKQNLGPGPALYAASALIIDYTLNVAVAVSAGVAALTSVAPVLQSHTLAICLCVLALITLVNLRGVPEAGLLFSFPTYLFVASFLGVIGVGVWRTWEAGGQPTPIIGPAPLPDAAQPLGAWVILRAFVSGCTAMTGVEAVSDGVSAFREPAPVLAKRTLTFTVAIVAALLAGVGYLCRVFGIGAMPEDQPGYQMVLSQLAAAVAGRGTIYYLSMGSLLAVLCLSANTSFVDFPRLARMLAVDGYLPRAFRMVGPRLVYSAGILVLAACSGALLVAFRGIMERLIPLFAVGAFVAFTLSQSAMVVHWLRARRAARAQASLLINGTGALVTAAALSVMIVSKFTEGAWLTLILLPGLVVLFRQIQTYYRRLDASLGGQPPLELAGNQPPLVLVPVEGWTWLTAQALRFALRLSPDVLAVHLSRLEGLDADDNEAALRLQWIKSVEEPARRAGVPPPRLVVFPSPYRQLVEPILHQVNVLRQTHPERVVCVVIPELVQRDLWRRVFHRLSAARLRRALLKRGDPAVVVASVPWRVED